MKTILALAALALSGCAASKATYLPDGTQGHNINCSGPYLNWGACYEKAGQLCKEHGYDVVHKEGDANETVTATQGTLIAGTNVQRTLIVRCRE